MFFFILISLDTREFIGEPAFLGLGNSELKGRGTAWPAERILGLGPGTLGSRPDSAILNEASDPTASVSPCIKMVQSTGFWASFGFCYILAGYVILAKLLNFFEF